jgi:hypothetical protein
VRAPIGLADPSGGAIVLLIVGVFEKTAADQSVEVMLRGSADPDARAVHVNVRWDEKS